MAGGGDHHDGVQAVFASLDEEGDAGCLVQVLRAAAQLVESVPYQRLTPGYTQARTTQLLPLPCRVCGGGVCRVCVLMALVENGGG